MEDERRRQREADERARSEIETERRTHFPELSEHHSFKITWHVLPDGRDLCGYFPEGSLTGIGSCKWPDGRVYEGGFVNGEMTGQGALTMPNGQVFAGVFVNGKIRGSGGQVVCATSAFPRGSDTPRVLPSEPAPRIEPRQKLHERRHNEDGRAEAGNSSDQKYDFATPALKPKSKNVGLALGFAIYAAPWLFAWVTLLPGYSKAARYVSFGWLFFLLAMSLFGLLGQQIN